MGAILLVNILFIALFYKELKLATFDAGLAAVLGFSPALIHYGLMTLVSVTAVGAFDQVGSVLVVALMIAPPAAAYLLTNSLSRMLVYSVLIGIASAIGGYYLARAVNGSLAGAMASMSGILFVVALLFAPERGLVAKAIQRRARRERFAVEMLLVHLSRHEKTAGEAIENSLAHLTGELNWTPQFADSAVQRADRQGYIDLRGNLLKLTEQGRGIVGQVLQR